MLGSLGSVWLTTCGVSPLPPLLLELETAEVGCFLVFFDTTTPTATATIIRQRIPNADPMTCSKYVNLFKRWQNADRTHDPPRALAARCLSPPAIRVTAFHDGSRRKSAATPRHAALPRGRVPRSFRMGRNRGSKRPRLFTQPRLSGFGLQNDRVTTKWQSMRR